MSIPKEAVPAHEQDVHTTEFQTEASIHGLTDIRDGNFLIGAVIDTEVESVGSLKNYEARINLSMKAEYDRTSISKNGYVHQGGLSGELAAILSIFFHCRIYITSAGIGQLSSTSIRSRQAYHVTRGFLPRWFINNMQAFGAQNFSNFTPFLESLEKLDKPKQQLFINACTNYNLALQQIGISDEMVYVRLVSAIESISHTLRLAKSDTALSKTAFDQACSNIKDNEMQKELKEVFQTRKATVKFKKFVKKYAQEYIDQRGEMQYGKITMDKLDDALDRIYKARSRYLHMGSPMFISVQHGDQKLDMDATLGMSMGMRKFDEEEKLPTIDFFEGLVRHCILSYIAEKQPTPTEHRQS